jgi:hypothetical protein
VPQTWAKIRIEWHIEVAAKKHCRLRNLAPIRLNFNRSSNSILGTKSNIIGAICR